MTRTSHRSHPTPSFPVYCLDWADDETLLLGGGGGASRSGIQNKLKVCKVSKDGRTVKYKSELLLSSDEDAPMTMAVDRETKLVVTGINAANEKVQKGENKQCRVFPYDGEKIEPVRSAGTITAEWSDDYPYQKLTSLSPSRNLLAVGTTDNRVTLLTFPTLDPIETLTMDAELVDVDWGGKDGQWLAVTTVSSLNLYVIGDMDSLSLKLKQTIYPPSIDISPVSFRAARFSPLASTTPTIHAVLNASKTPAKRGAPRKSFVCTFGVVAGPSHAAVTPEERASKGKEKAEVIGEGDEEELGRWDVLVRREVAGKPVTVFDVSADGRLLAYGCSDLSLGILDSKTLAPLLKILAAHSFPPTALKFNPSASLLVSASADNTIRAVSVPASFEGLSMSMIALFAAILLIILAILLRR